MKTNILKQELEKGKNAALSLGTGDFNHLFIVDKFFFINNLLESARAGGKLYKNFETCTICLLTGSCYYESFYMYLHVNAFIT